MQKPRTQRAAITLGGPVLFAKTSSVAVPTAAIGITSAHGRALMAILAPRYTVRTVPMAAKRIGVPIPTVAGAIIDKSIADGSVPDEPRTG